MGWDEHKYIGKNVAASGVTTAAVTGNRDGTLLERTEFIISNVVVETEDIKTDVEYLYAVADGGTTSPTKVLDNSILSILMTKDSGGDTSDFNNSTDSLEAQSDKLGGFSGDGGAAQDDSVKASLDLAHTDIDNIYTDTQAIAIVVDDIQTSLLPTLSADVASLQSDVGDPSTRTNLKSIETMLGNPDTTGKTVYEAVKNIRETAINGSSTPTANTLSDILHKDGSYTYDKTTDSLEAISDAIVSGSYSVVADSGTSTTVVDATYTQANDYWNGTLLVCVSGTNAGQGRPVVDFANATGTFTVYPAFNEAVVATDTFLLISGWKFAEWIVMPDVPVTDTVTTTESDAVLLELATAGQSYRINNVRLKFADPGANTVTVKLYELINDVSTEVDSFTVTTDNYSSYHGLVDMFGTSHLAGDNLKISAVMDAGTCAVTGQYSYEKSYTA